MIIKFNLPRTHLPMMPVGPDGARCTTCRHFDFKKSICREPNYYAAEAGHKRPGDRRLVDPTTGAVIPADQFCSDWFEPLE